MLDGNKLKDELINLQKDLSKTYDNYKNQISILQDKLEVENDKTLTKGLILRILGLYDTMTNYCNLITKLNSVLVYEDADTPIEHIEKLFYNFMEGLESDIHKLEKQIRISNEVISKLKQIEAKTEEED